MATKSEIIVDSNNTYVPNTSGLITPQLVQTLNTNWINSSIFPEQTGSMSVASASLATSASFATNAATASLLLGAVASASYAYTASSAVNATNALTASFVLGTVASASLAANSLLLQGTGSNGFATTASLATVSSSLQAVSASNQQLSASYIALSGSYNTFSGSASTRLTNTSQSLQAVSASGQQVSASYIALSASYNTFSGSASTRITANSSSIQSVSASTQQVSASYIALSASYNVFSGSASARITAVSSSDQQTSASYVALSGSYNVFSGSASTRITSLESFSSSLSTTFATDAELNAATQSLSASISTVNSSLTVVSASLQAVSSSTQQVSASYIALSASYNVFSGSASTRITNNSASISALNTATGSFAVLSANQTFSGTNTFNNAVTMSNVRVTGTASIAFLDVTFQSSSIIYSSGSNQFGDASNDTQTLWGTVDVISGPLVVTGSANFKNVITGSISGNAATATTSTSASFANTAEFATTASLASFAVIASAALTASYATTASSAEKSFEAVSSSYAFTASSAISASFASVAASVLGTITSASYAYTASSAVNAASSISASYAYTASSAVNATSASFATTASFALNAGGGSAFPYSGSAEITGSLGVTGSIMISTGSLLLYSYKSSTDSNRSFEALVTQSYNSTNNIISIVNPSASTTGSMVISGSGNYVSLSQPPTNTSNANGATSGFNGTNAYITVLPITSGSNPNYNTATDRNNRAVPVITNSNVNALIAANDNRSQTGTFLSVTNSSINSTITANIGSGSFSIGNSNIAGTNLTLFVSNSFGGNATHQIGQSIIAGASMIITGQASGSRSPGVTNSIIGGGGIRLLLSSSIATNPRIDSSLIVGDNLVITSSWYTNGFSNIPVGSAFLGSFNKADGILNNPEHTRFAIGTGIGDSSGNRRTSLAVSASGLTTIFDGLVVTGSLKAQAISSSFSGSGAQIFGVVSSSYALTASFALNAAGGAAFPFTGSAQITGSLGVTGSTSIVGSLSSTDKYLLGGDLSLIPITSNQAVITSWWGMQLVGNKQSSVDYSPSGIGANDDFSVIVPTQQASKIGLIVKGQTNQTGNLLELRDVNNNGWSAFSKSGSLSLGKTTGGAALDVLGNTLVTGSAEISGSLSVTGSINCYNNITAQEFFVNTSIGTNTIYSRSTGTIYISPADATIFTTLLDAKAKITVTGSLVSQPVSQSVSSLTASLDLTSGSFFNLTLPASANTYVTASGQVPGQTVNIKVTQGATTGSLSFGAGFKQVSGSFYTGSSTANAVDIVTLISFDSTGLYVSNVNNLI